MFLGDLGEEEKRTFLILAWKMVSADGRVTNEEREMLQDAQEEMGLGTADESPDCLDDLNECCKSVTSSKARALMLLELASFAFVDRDYDVRERELLRTVAEIWRLDEISVVRVEEWARKRVELATEAAEVVQEVEMSLLSRQDDLGGQ